MLPMPAEGTGSLAYWRNQLKSAKDTITTLAQTRKWDANIDAYLGKGGTWQKNRHNIAVNKDFALTESKKALLFFQTPNVQATAHQPQSEQAAPLVAAVMNAHLHQVDAKTMVDEVLMDVLCPAGVGVSKIGYECFVDPATPEIPVPNPLAPDSPLTGPDGKPILQPNMIRERYFWERIPPKMFRYPSNFHGSDFDRASWLGFDFELEKVVAARLYDKKTDALPSSGDQTQNLLSSDTTRKNDASQKVTLTEVWYRACDVDPNISDPEVIRQLVFMDGREDAPLVHRDSPYQTIENGTTYVSGMKGYPIHVLTLRYVSDQAIPPSDCSVSRSQVDELSIGRTQMINNRDRAIPLTGYDTTRVASDALAKIMKGDIQEWVGFNGVDTANPPTFPITKGQWPRENFAFNDIIERDISEYWSLGPNQRGVDTDTKRTATELSIMQAATDTRMDAERVKVLRWYGRGAEKSLALVQMFSDEAQYVRIVGQDGLPALMAWDKSQIAGDYSITLAADSSQRVDGAADKKAALNTFQMLGNDPLVDQLELRKWLVGKLGLPSNLVKPPQPKPPEQPQVSVSIKGEDLNPLMPQYPNIVTLLAANGIGVQSPEGMGATPPPTNPGTVPKVVPINKRAADEGSGKLPGAGKAPDVAQVGGR